MTSTPSAVLSLELQAQNDNTGAWWANANQIFQGIEDAIAKEVALSTTGGDTALSVASYSVDQSRCAIIRIGAGQTLLSLVRVTTVRARLYFVTNETSAGAFDVKFGGDTSNLVTIPRNTGAWVRVRSTAATTFAGPLVNLTTGAIDGASLASGAFLLGASNLSDLASAATARTNLGLAIGTNVQAYDADLTTWAGLTPSANAQSLVTAASYAAMRTLLGLVIGTNVQAWDAELDSLSAASANGVSLVTAANYATMRTLLSLAYAAQSDQEIGTSTATVVAPGTQKHHPCHPKASGRFNTSGTILGTAFGVTSVVRNSVGSYTVTLAAAMSDTNYGVLATPNNGTNVGIMDITITSTTVFTINSLNTAGTGIDLSICFAVFGDMP